MALSRRKLLRVGVAGSAAVLVGTSAVSSAVSPAPRWRGNDPFMLGVASGDPTPDGVVLWTRLAPDPLAPDGRGGMGWDPVTVEYEVAQDESFRQVVSRGTAVATRDLAHSVHPEIQGLEPARWYFYRFRAGSAISPVGRTRTAPAPGEPTQRMRFAFASCQSWSSGFYTAYEHMCDEDLDLVVHLGDYIYERGWRRGREGMSMGVDRGEAVDLPSYRLRYAQYKAEQPLRDAHAAFPWIVTMDDHEVDNNWAADSPDITMLDTRQYRDPQACEGNVTADCTDRLDADRTILGAQQRDWLLDGFTGSPARWQIIGNQVAMGQTDNDPGPDVVVSTDSWDGYVADRNTILGAAADRSVRNLVVITGDRHQNIAADLRRDYENPESPVVASEFTGTSITSAGDGTDMNDTGRSLLAANPDIKFFNAQRGYVRVDLDHQLWRNDFRVVPYIRRPGAPIHTRASFVVQDQVPGVTEASRPDTATDDTASPDTGQR